jgi:hypothetical protein
MKKHEELFNLFIRKPKDKKFKSGLLAKPFIKNNVLSLNLNLLPIFSEESLNNSKLLNLKNYQLFATELALDSIDDTYENVKYLNYLYHINYKNLITSNVNTIYPISYATILDNFCAGYEEGYNYVDAFSNKYNPSFNNNTPLTLNHEIRLTNPSNTRSTAKSSIVTFNAIQKVFRSRLDEGRSNARLEDFSNSYVKHPFLTEKRVNYEALLGKNKENFFHISTFNRNFRSNISNIYSLLNSTNIYFIDLPFLVSMKSDPSRYLWFDWQSKWASIEVAASSPSRFTLLGLPYSSKNFEYSTNIGDELSESETYLVKLAKARKNYLSN